MMFSNQIRKLVLFLHVSTSVALIGAVASFLTLAIVGISFSNSETQWACSVAMNIIARFVVLPLTILSLIVGILSSLGTPWGLVRFYWVIAKLILTAITLIVLLLQMHAISQLAEIAIARNSTLDDFGLQMRMIVHGSGGLGVLIAIMVLSIWKPRGQINSMRDE